MVHPTEQGQHRLQIGAQRDHGVGEKPVPQGGGERERDEGVSAPRALVPLALASALWYGLLTYAVVTLGANLEAGLAPLPGGNHVPGVPAPTPPRGPAPWAWR